MCSPHVYFNHARKRPRTSDLVKHLVNPAEIQNAVKSSTVATDETESEVELRQQTSNGHVGASLG